MHPGKLLTRKKKEEIGNQTADEVKTTNIQHGFVAKGSVPLKSGKKRKFEGAENMSESNKKMKADQIVIVTNEPSSPSGLVWDGANCSCAYDALFAVLYDIWSNDTNVWTRKLTCTISSHCLSVFNNI